MNQTLPRNENTPPSPSRRQALHTLLAGGLLLSGAGGAMAVGQSTPASPRKGGRLTVATQSSSTADTLDPAKGALSTDYMRAHMFYSGLTTLDAQLAAQMALAERFESDDAKVWVVTLRRGVQFHDGKPLSAADVVFSLNRHKLPAVASKVGSVTQQFESVTAIDPLTVEIRLSGPNADLPVILAASHFVILQDGTTTFRTAIGTGPYRCKEFTPGVRTIGSRNENYWRPGFPHLDEIFLLGIPDEPARVNALLSGNVDWINDVNPRSIRRIREEPGCTVLESKSGLYTDLVIRQNVGLGRHPDFTLGMKYLIDREQIKRAAFRGYAVIGNDQPLAPNHRYHLAGLPQRPYDPDRARFHLNKAGASGLILPVVASVAAAGSVDMAMLLQQSAYKAGLKLSLKRVSADGYWSNHWMKSPIGFGNINPRPSADMLFTQFFKSDSQWNESGWNNSQFDELLLLARGETDELKRRQHYADMQVLIHQKCGIGIPVFITNLEAYAGKVRGVTAHPLGSFMGYAFAEHVWLDA